MGTAEDLCSNVFIVIVQDIISPAGSFLQRALVVLWSALNSNKPKLTVCSTSNPGTQVFDGHNGAHAAQFASDHLLEYLVADESYPAKLRRALVRPTS